MLKDFFDCVFFTAEPSFYQIGEIQNVCPYVKLSESSKFDVFLDCLDGSEIVVLDNYFYTTDYQLQIKDKGCKLVCIDDPHGIKYVCDVLISHGFYSETDFDCSKITKRCIGINWAMLRKPFLAPKAICPRNSDIIVNFGGSDFFHITDHIVGLLISLRNKKLINGVIKVILGDRVEIAANYLAEVQILRNLSASEMVNLFDESGLGIFAASTVCIEALSRDFPIVVGYDVENQERVYFNMERMGIISPLGYLQSVTEEMLLNSIYSLSTINKLEITPEAIPARFVDLFSKI